MSMGHSLPAAASSIERRRRAVGDVKSLIDGPRIDKHCFVYCGDDACTCSAGPNWHSPPVASPPASVEEIDVEIGNEAAIRAAFPELFDGTAWLAPMEPTTAMIEAAIDRFDYCWSREPGEGLDEEPGPPLYRAMRDAHLSPETDAKVEG
jgi:hypothetical protein